MRSVDLIDTGINVPEAGKNYGWPVVSYGVNYDGTPVGTGESSAPGMEEPIYQWTPVMAASALLFSPGAAFPEWKGDLFNGGLAATTLVRLELDGRNVTHEEQLLEDLGLRICAVEQGPGGELYVLTDEDNGEVLRISPAGETASE